MRVLITRANDDDFTKVMSIAETNFVDFLRILKNRYGEDDFIVSFNPMVDARDLNLDPTVEIDVEIKIYDSYVE